MTTEELRAPLDSALSYMQLIRDLGLSSLFGSLFGALSAAYLTYWFRLAAERKKETDQNFIAGLKAHFSLSSQLMIARHILKEYLEPLRNDPTRGIGLRSYHIDLHHQTVDFSGLAFLLDKSVGAEALNLIFHAETLFKDVISFLYRRNDLHDAYLADLNRQQHLASPNMDHLLQTNLEEATDDLYATTDAAVSALYDQLLALGNLLGERFKDRKDSIPEIVKDW
jgi:hypothetical protein